MDKVILFSNGINGNFIDPCTPERWERALKMALATVDAFNKLDERATSMTMDTASVVVSILQQVGITMVATGISTFLVLRHLDRKSKPESKVRPIRGSSDTTLLTIDVAIEKLERARETIGGDKMLIACLSGSELEDTGDLFMSVIQDGESKYVEIAVRHPTLLRDPKTHEDKLRWTRETMASMGVKSIEEMELTANIRLRSNLWKNFVNSTNLTDEEKEFWDGMFLKPGLPPVVPDRSRPLV